METMNFEGPGFTLQVPTNWMITSAPQIQAMFVSPPRLGGRANFMVTLRPLAEDVTLDQVAKNSLETQKKEYDQFELVKESEYRKGKAIGRQRVYRWFSKEHNAKILQRQVLFVSHRMLTNLTATRTDLAELKDVDALFEQMLDSFKFA